jgi:hypothetical protein
MLMAVLQANYVLQAIYERDLLDRLERLPKTPTELYQSIIRQMSLEEQELARRIMSWLYFAQKPLTLRELQQALSVESGSPYLDQTLAPSAKQILTTCRDLVVHDGETDLMYFAHNTVEIFVGENPEIRLPQDMITLICLTYLNFSIFDTRCPDPQTYNKLRSRYVFGDYVVIFWHIHAVRSSETVSRDIEVETRILEALGSQGRRDAITEWKTGWGQGIFGKSLTQMLVEAGVAFIFMTPLPNERIQSL